MTDHSMASQVQKLILDSCLAEFKDRQSKVQSPMGDWDYKNHFVPSPAEWCPECDKIKRKSLKDRQRFMAHLRSIGHVAFLYHVHPRDLRVAYKEQNYHG